MMILNSNRKKSSTYNKIFQLVLILVIVLLVLNFLFENSSLFYRKSVNLPFTLHLNKQDLYLVKGEEYHLYVFGINKRVSFSSTNFRVVGVNFNGRVFGYQTGKAFILAKVNSRLLKCRVHVVDINKDTLRLKVGDTYHLDIKGSSAFTRWKSGDPEVASVNMFGKVKAKRMGKSVLTAKIKGKELMCKVWVE